MTRVQPLSGEKLVMRLKPHPLAFWHLYAISLLLIFLGYALERIYVLVAGFRLRLPLPFLQQYNAVNVLVFWAVLIGTGIVIGLVYLRITSLLVFSSVALIGTLLTEYFKMPLEVHLWLLAACGLAGFAFAEFYRRGHNYYITNLRVVMEKSFISYDSRQFTYSRIEDLAIVQGLLGRVLNYGTIVPVTASGFGLGEDSASAGIGGALGVGGRRSLPVGGGIGLSASGGRAVLIPRGRTYHTLYGISRPREVQHAIAMMIQGQVPSKQPVGPYL